MEMALAQSLKIAVFFASIVQKVEHSKSKVLNELGEQPSTETGNGNFEIFS